MYIFAGEVDFRPTCTYFLSFDTAFDFSVWLLSYQVDGCIDAV